MLIVFLLVYTAYTTVCVLYSNCYMLHMFSMGLMLIVSNVMPTTTATAETFRSSFFFFRYSIG